MVEVDGTGRPSRSRCQAIVTGPASSPRAVSSRPEGDDPVADRVGVWPRAGQGSAGTWLEGLEPAVAVAAEQAREVLRLIPYAAAAAVTDSCLETTLRTATRCFDMRPTVTHVPTHQARSAVAYVVNSDTSPPSHARPHAASAGSASAEDARGILHGRGARPRIQEAAWN